MADKKVRRPAAPKSRGGGSDPFTGLTWFDLENWAGRVIVDRGRDYQRRRLVADLARTSAGGLVAWVHGTRRYAVSVECRDGVLSSRCTCPYDGTCKHAVAVVLAYLADLQHGRLTPEALPEDGRLKKLSAGDRTPSGYADAEPAEEGLGGHASSPLPKAVEARIKKLTKEQVLALLAELAGRFPDVRQALVDRAALASGDWRSLASMARREIADLAAREWDEDDDEAPDPARMRDLLAGLLDLGQAGEVLALGRELLGAGVELIETGIEGLVWKITSCLEVVLEALPRSNLPPAEQMLWLAEAELEDDYDLLPDTTRFWSRKHPAAEWSRFADELAKRLRAERVGREEDSFSRAYRRDRITDRVIAALERAGRTGEIIPLCEREAELTGSYVRLVERLAAEGGWARAESWIEKGIAAVKNTRPGIADQLRKIRLEHAVSSCDWRRVAGLSADDFFREPSADTYGALCRAAENAQVRPAVREAALRFLTDGTLPPVRGAGGAGAPVWPLAPIERPEPHPQRAWRFPMGEILLDIAVAEKRPVDVVFWYDSLAPSSRGRSMNEKVADAVASSHPERALTIWKEMAEQLIAVTQPSAYLEASGYLRRLKRLLLQFDRKLEWRAYLAELKNVHARKKRLLEILGRLEEEPIIKGKV